MARVCLVAEAGVNHNGSLELAKHIIDAAIDAGADAVKFQAYKTECLVSKYAGKARYQALKTDSKESQFDLLKRFELGRKDFLELKDYCACRNIEFLASVFDASSLSMIVSMGANRIKIPSGEITNLPLLVGAARTRLPTVLSTGMSTLSEIGDALAALAFGYLESESPSPGALREAYACEEGRRILGEKIIILHCSTCYPASPENVNLRAMRTISRSFGLPVGYSDHTQGINVSVAAVALGACMIERHLTISRALEGPDQEASLEPHEFKEMARAVREVERAMGDSEKVPAPEELEIASIARKSLVAAKAIRKGEMLTEENITIKRPGTGVSAALFWEVLGKRASRDYGEDELIEY